MEKKSVWQIVNDCFDVSPVKLAAWNLICEGYSEEDVLHEAGLSDPVRISVANAVRDLSRKMKSDPLYNLKELMPAALRTRQPPVVPE